MKGSERVQQAGLNFELRPRTVSRGKRLRQKRNADVACV
jgi:hypothetical protein